jgi:Fe-S-cluster containining protein
MTVLDSAPIPERACRPDCGACCIAPSISSPIPGMPHGKPAGVRCVQLGADERCLIFGRPERPAVCGSLRPSDEMCGDSREHAIEWLHRIEASTAPARPRTEGPSQVQVDDEAQPLTQTAIR